MAQQHVNAVFYATTYHPIQAGSIDGTDTASHDNGVYRALIASSTGLYDPTGDPKAKGDPYCTLFVGRLAHHTTENTLQEVMNKYGKVKHLRLVRHIVTGASRGYAFVEFESENDMQNAYEMAHQHIIDGSSILVDYDRQQLMPGWIPRRLGGGLGGHKQSGQLRFGGRDRPFRAPLRTIPTEKLKKLGIPLPPVGQYMSRFQLPPIPLRPGSLKEGTSRKQNRAHRGSASHEAVGDHERVQMKQRAEVSPRHGRRSADPERGSSTHREYKRRETGEGDDEERYSQKRDLGDDRGNQHKRSRFDCGDEVGSEHFTMSNHEDRGSSQHRGDDSGSQHKRRSGFDRGDEVGYEHFTRSGHEDRESSHYRERSMSKSGHKDIDRWHLETSTGQSGDEDRDSGHHGRHGHHRKRERGLISRESTAEYDRSPKHGSKDKHSSKDKHGRKESKRSHSKHRSKEDDNSET